MMGRSARYVVLALAVSSASAAQEAAPGEAGEPASTAPVASSETNAETKADTFSARVTTGYPTRALAENREGTVHLTVTVTPEGRATDCTVTQSSGHVILDQAACAEIEQKARFAPALDERGQPTAAQFSTKVTFRIK